MITIVKAFPNPHYRSGRSRFVSHTLGKVLVIDEIMDFPNRAGFAEVEIVEERGDKNGGVFVGEVRRILQESDYPIHLPATFYEAESFNGVVVLTPAAESPTGYILSANVRQALLRPASVYAVIVKHGIGPRGWMP